MVDRSLRGSGPSSSDPADLPAQPSEEVLRLQERLQEERLQEGQVASVCSW